VQHSLYLHHKPSSLNTMPTLSTIGAACARAWGFTSGLVKDQYFNLVSLLLPGNGTNGAQNNTFLDSGTANSGSGFTITRNGNTTQGTISPFSQTGWGAYFDGSNDYISIADNAAIQVGQTYTIEGWFFPTTTAQLRYFGKFSFGVGGYLLLADSTSFTWYYANNGAATITGSWSPNINAWNHIAVSSNSSTMRVWLNGTSIGSVSSPASTQNDGGALRLGDYNGTAAAAFAGYQSNFRIVKGSVVYNPSSTSITVPTSPLTAVTDTTLLICQSNRFRDASVSNLTVSPINGVAITPFSPFAPTQSYSASAVGGSGYFDVVDDFLTWGPGSSVQFGTGNFTIEVWIYITVTPAGQYIIDGRNSGQTTAFALLFGATGLGRLAFFDGSIVAVDEATPSIKANEWAHCCVVRSGSTISLFINGVRAGVNSSYSGNMSTAPTLSYIGKRYAAVFGDDFEFPGYMSSLRIVKGTAVYDPTQTNITIPTAPLTAITNTSLLLNFTNAGVVDATAKNVLETEGNAQISTAQSKWGGGSIKFDGTGDAARIPDDEKENLRFGTGNFTIEFWAWKSANGSMDYDTVISIGSTGSYNGGFSVELSASRGFCFIYDNAIRVQSNFNPNDSTWNHYAVVRDGSTFALYKNGSRLTTATLSTTLGITGTAYVGAGALTDNSFNGYIDDLRVTKGLARYTGTTYTTPTAPFPLQ
jgi:hypothetical protein